MINSFENLTLPFEQWDQRTHVSIAHIYIREHGLDEALIRMRRGVKAYNAHHGIKESPTSGYNETTTVAFLHLIDAVMKSYGKVFPTADAGEFCDAHPQLMSKHVLRFFYSPERRMLPQAKEQFVEPDLAPLPKTRKNA